MDIQLAIRKVLVFPVKHFDYTFKYEFIIKKEILKITKKPVEISMVCTFIYIVVSIKSKTKQKNSILLQCI